MCACVRISFQMLTFVVCVGRGEGGGLRGGCALGSGSNRAIRERKRRQSLLLHQRGLVYRLAQCSVNPAAPA